MEDRQPTRPGAPLPAAERRKRERRLWRTGFVVSLLVHLTVFLLWRHEPVFLSPFAAAGPRAGDDRAAQGSMQAMNLSSKPPGPIVPPSVPLPQVVAEVDAQTLDLEMDRARPSGLEGLTDPGLDAPGLENGQGKGDGGNAAEGRFRMVPPSPRGMIIPPANKKLKGQQVEVWVFVNEKGKVVPDSTRLRPPTSDKDFNQRLIREAAEWVFQPAMKGGKPVATWFPYTISM